MSETPQLDCALDLMRRLPPQKCERNMIDLVDLVPHLTQDILSLVDQPLKVASDANGKNYLLCDYNRDGDSYRSPWTNTFDPPLEDGQLPSDKLRKFEIEANAAFESYRDMYFEGGISSAYFWDCDNGFAGIVLIKKSSDGARSIDGEWDSIHVLDVTERTSRQAHYKLTSTLMVWLQTTKPHSGKMNLGGSLTRQMELDCSLNEQNTHLVNIGKMIEDLESKMRSTINEIYFGKTKKVVGDLRSVEPASEREKQDGIVRDIVAGVTARGGSA